MEERAETSATRKLREVETFKAVAAARTEAKAAPALPLHFGGFAPVLAILVVLRTLLGVGNNFVGLGQGLKLRLGFRVVGVQVGVELLGSAPIGCTHVLLRRVARNTENFVVIYESHCMLCFVITLHHHTLQNQYQKSAQSGKWSEIPP